MFSRLAIALMRLALDYAKHRSTGTSQLKYDVTQKRPASVKKWQDQLTTIVRARHLHVFTSERSADSE